MREMHSIGFPYPHYSYDGVCLTLSIPLSKESLTTMFPQLKKLSPEELSIVEFIRENKMVTKAMVASKLNISEKTAQRRLSSLLDKGFIAGNGEAKLPRNMAMLFQVLYLDGQHHGRFDYDQPISTK